MVNLPELKTKASAAAKQLKEGRKNKTISLKQAYDLLDEIMTIGKDLKKTETDEKLAKNLLELLLNIFE